MLSRLNSPLLFSLILAGAACNGGGNTSATDTTSTGTTDTTTTDTTAEPTTTEPTPTTTTETTADPTTETTAVPTTTEPMDPTTTTEPMPSDCAAPADDGDEDGDSIANKDDNCRCVANPNQLDFDGNNIGNVCDEPLTFTVADGTPPEFNQLATQATAAQSIAMCQFPVNLVAIGGEVQVTLDDEGTGKVWAAQLNFADTPQLECDIAFIVNVKLVIKSLVITGPEMFAVGFPFNAADHDGGMITGLMDAIHAIVVNGVIDVQESSNPGLAMPGMTPLEDVAGSFPAGTVTVVESGKQITIDFNDGDHTVFQQQTPGGLEITLSGLTGKLRLRK